MSVEHSVERTAKEQTQRQNIAESVKNILVYESRVNMTPDLISDDEPLNGTLLRITSLSLLGMIMSLEDELNINLEDEGFMKARFVTVGDLIDFIYQTYCDQHVQEED